MPYRLLTLGPPALFDPASSPVDLPLGKPFALLVYLAIEPGPVGREDLATLFWGGAPRDRARQSVRQALWLLRRTLGPEAFRSEDPVELSPAAVSVDLVDLRAALSAGDVTTATTLWRGAFIERFALGGARAWQRWVEEQRDAAANEFVGALLDTVTTERDAGRLAGAIELLRRAVSVAPHKVAAHGLLIESLLDAHELDAAGSAIAEARRQFGDAARGIDFAHFDQRLAAARTHTLGQGRTGPELSTEFVGRATELADLLGLWWSARAGHTRAVLIRGPTGIGKSRLTAEAAAGADEGTIVTAKASEAERDIEHGLAATLVRRLLRLRGAAGVSGASDAVLRALVPSLSNGNGNTHDGPHRHGGSAGDPDSRPAGPVSTVALADALADLISAVAEESPLFVVVDDVQWADASSRSVIARLLRRVRDVPCLFLLTVRPEDAPPELAMLLRTLEQEHILAARSLEPLTVSVVAELLGLMAEFPDNANAERVANRLHAVTGGNPLFLVELVRALHEDGVVEYGDGRWIFHADRLPNELALPASVHAVVDRRLDRLSPDAAALAGHLARLPRGGSLATLRQRANLSEGAFTRAAGELLERDVARWADSERIEFTHDQLRDGAARRFPVGAVEHSGPEDGTRRRGRQRRTAFVTLLATLLVAAPLFVWRHELGFAGRPLYGGGDLYFKTGDSLFMAKPPGQEGGEWTVRPVPGLGPGFGNMRRRGAPFYGPDGQRMWLRRAGVQGRPSASALVTDGGNEWLMLQDSGDVVGGTISPDGRYITFFRDPSSTRDYDWQLMLARTDGSGEWAVAGPSPSVSFGQWAPDGSAFSARARGEAVDSILVFAPDLSRIAAIPLPGRTFATPGWCTHDRIIAQLVATDEPQLAVIDPWAGNVRVLGGPGPETAPIACSPDGSAAVFSAVAAGRLATVLHSLEDSGYRILDLRSGATMLDWLPSHPARLPATVTIRSPPALEAGDTLRLEAVVRANDGGRWTGPVRWRALHEHVLSIDSAGVITANRPGRALVVATTTNWISDTVGIEVRRGESSTDLALDEPFATLDTARWIVVGDAPAPWPVVDEGEPALRLTGDGQYEDGLHLREPLRLPRGATLEAEFRLGLTRWDRQSFGLCLGDPRLLPGRDGHDPHDWIYIDLICFHYPAFLQTTSDSTRASVIVGPTTRLVDVTPDLPGNRWTHVAIEVRPDGQVDFFLNRRHVNTAPIALTNVTSREWRVIVIGESLDTELFVRGLALWHGLRY